MRFYLAGPWARGAELAAVAAALAAQGHAVTSTWLWRHPDPALWLPPQAAAEEDLFDIVLADALVAFTGGAGAPAPGEAGGGRYVEFGYAYALGRRLILVGPRELIFHHLDAIEAVYPDPAAFLAAAPAYLEAPCPPTP